MGQILRVFLKDNDNFCCNIQQRDVFVDFENATPMPDEVEAYNKVQDFLERSKSILNIVKSYEGDSIFWLSFGVFVNEFVSVFVYFEIFSSVLVFLEHAIQ